MDPSFTKLALLIYRYFLIYLDPAQTPAPNLQTLADQLFLTRYTLAAALTNDKGDILYING